MSIGLIGAGSMARAMAIGWRLPVWISDNGSGRAWHIADEVGGTAASNHAVAEATEIVFLAHKPAQLEDVAAQIRSDVKVVVSMLAATPLDKVAAVYPMARSVIRIMPNTPVELHKGVTCVANDGRHAQPADRARVIELLERLGEVVELDEMYFEIATAIGGCAPAFFALFAQELSDAAQRRGLPTALATRIVSGTMIGSAHLLDQKNFDAQNVIQAVASPGGLTERALHSLSDSGLQDAVDKAVATVIGEIS